MKANLGSGWDVREGYVNIDFAPHHKPDVAADVLHLPLKTDSLEEVYAQDVLEHLPRTSTAEVLTEWHRVTAPDGVARIRVPSLFHAVDVMRAADTLDVHQLLIQNLYGTQAYTGDVHLTSFTDRTIADLFHSAGYRRVSAELVDRWMWNVTAWGTGGLPVAVFWGTGFHEVEGFDGPIDYEGESSAWRWVEQNASISIVNTGDTAIRALLGFTVYDEQTAVDSLRLTLDGREWSADHLARVLIEVDLGPGGRQEVALHSNSPVMRSEGDPRDLAFRVLSPQLTLSQGDDGAGNVVHGATPVAAAASAPTVPAVEATPAAELQPAAPSPSAAPADGALTAQGWKSLPRRGAARALDRLADSIAARLDHRL